MKISRTEIKRMAGKNLIRFGGLAAFLAEILRGVNSFGHFG
jgi:hypothetical protein